MSQIRLHLEAPKTQAEAVYRALEVRFEDEGYPLAIIETDEAARIYEVSLYADDEDAGVEPAMRAISDEFAPQARIAREVLPDIDWVALTLSDLKPVRAGRFLVHGSHDRDAVRPGTIPVEIDAGRAFGTGHHGTTAGCLEMIEAVQRRERPANALDVGTGSAVLAIALARAARIPVLATDIDPVAVDVARANVRLNRAAGFVSCVTATGLRHAEIARRGPFDLIAANILARPLMRLAPDMARRLAPGGSLILSGILDGQRNAVLAAYVGQRFRHVRTLHREGWTTLHLKR